MIYDALIIGAGPAGATIARLLTQAGWSVAIVEKHAFPRRKVCGEFISATSLPLLYQLGIADFYLSKAGPEIRRVGLYAKNTILSSAMPSVKHPTSHWGRALGREHLDTALLDLAVKSGATLWQPAEVTHLDQRHDLSTCTINKQGATEQITTRRIIMANGSWERNQLLPPAAPHQPSDLLAFKAHFTDSHLAPDLMPLLAFPGGYGGMVTTDSGRVTLSCCIRRETLQKARQIYSGLSAGEATLQHICDTSLGVKQVLLNAKREGQWLAVGPIRPGIRQQYADGRFYVGNIAAEAHPIVAEGISMAMQSSWLLSQALLMHRSQHDAAQYYRQQWKQFFSKRIHAAALFSTLAMRPWLVTGILPLLRSFPRLLTIGAKISGKSSLLEA